MTALSLYVLSTFAARLLGGLVHTFLSKRGRHQLTVQPVAGEVTLVSEQVQMTIILLMDLNNISSYLSVV
ncbi:MAG: hypothetical protein G5663_06275 [Serratia symbiotica]|nr:hypothetical protein [Serratia symbiotica]